MAQTTQVPVVQIYDGSILKGYLHGRVAWRLRLSPSGKARLLRTRSVISFLRFLMASIFSLSSAPGAGAAMLLAPAITVAIADPPLPPARNGHGIPGNTSSKPIGSTAFVGSL